MPIEAFIYDMDGVLVDSEIYWMLSRQAFAAVRGKTWTDEWQREVMGRSTMEWARIMRDRLQLDEPLENIVHEMKGRVLARFEERLPTRPGAIESVHALSKHFRVALASGSPTDIIQRIMHLTGLDEVFEVMCYGDDVEHGKPAPDIYLLAMSKLGVTPDVCAGVEDSANGIRSLHAAGAKVIAAPSPGFTLPTDVLALANAQIVSMEELTVELVRGLEKA
jgi:HAD superfamily hydrolase (TIGR01509 family)